MGRDVTDALRLDRQGGVARLTLCRAAKHNAFDDALIAELTRGLRALGSDDTVRSVVLAAEGKSFSAGADLQWMRRMAGHDRAANLADARALAGLMRTLDGLPKPTIAAVQGAAFGGGVGLVACCDIAVASDAARFSLSEVRLGLIPSVIGPYVIAAIGARAARRYFQTAERFDAATALRLGLVHEVVPAAALDGTIDAITAAIGEAGPSAVAAAKALVRDVAAAPLGDELVEDTAARIADIRASAEGREGVTAFLESRPPAWREG